MSRSLLAPKPSSGCAVLFFGVFGVVGFLVVGGLTLRPAWQILRAQTWEAVPCEVVHSEVTSSDGETYAIDVRCAYRYAGQSYVSEDYDFRVGSSSGRRGKQQIANAHPVGSAATVFVNPSNPSQAVMNRDAGMYLLWGLIGVPFLLVPLVPWLTSRQRSSPLASRGGLPLYRDPSLVQLNPKITPRARFVGIAMLAVIWNAITWAAVLAFWSDMDACLFSFLGVFVISGISLLVGSGYELLRMFNPHPVLSLPDGDPVLGRNTTVSWVMQGNAARLRRLTLTLVGEERATYQRGTDSVTETHVFFTQELLNTTDGMQIARGSTTVALPADAAPTFDGGHNAIVWRIEVAGVLLNWPDVESHFPLTVFPESANA
ncbi:MAG: DUF3592 domain-containing protein [Myxococcota bacterium]